MFYKSEMGCIEKWKDGQLVLGCGEIRVFGKQETIYAAPDMIFHFVKVHHYCPPAEFIEALDQAPDPSSDVYVASLSRIKLKPYGPLTERRTWP